MSVLKEILAWSASQQPWVRDALRRIITKPEITDGDIEELAELCKKPQGLSSTTYDGLPLAEEHLPSSAQDGPVRLVSLTHIADVNALAPNETIHFGKTGLTIIFGNNGAGKSGYGRIMKRACRARGSGDAILANQLSEKPAGPPTARFVFEKNSVEQEHVWKDGNPSPMELGAVSVFDSSAAQVYVSDKTEVRFRPLGLDVMDKLGDVCTRVKSRLEDEQKTLKSQLISLPTVPSSTEAGRFLSMLTALTKRDDVERVAHLSEEERRELEKLNEVVVMARSENPTKKASDYKNKAARLRRLFEELKSLSLHLSETAAKRMVDAREEAKTAQKVAQEAAEKFGRQVELAGIDSNEWRELWESARSYSEARAYPKHSFPHVEGEAKCVLCQQEMPKPVVDRLLALEEFTKGSAQSDAQAKQKIYNDLLAKYRLLNPGEANKEALEDLQVLSADEYKAVTQFVDEAKIAVTTFLNADGISVPIPVLTSIPDLVRLADDCDSRAADIVKATNPAEMKKTEDRLGELNARSMLEASRAQIYAEIERRGRINAYEQCMKSTDTRALTALSTDLTKRYVTDALAAAFDDEIKQLEFINPELQLSTAGAKKGVLYHQVFLKHSTKAELAKVVSEGESRCIALAAFMAEVRGAAHPSAIIFDDPVSSLDHRWRTNVAKRLVKEASVRQVVVFTHEIVFLSALIEEAELADVPRVTQTVSRGRDFMAGHVDPELPWDATKVKTRLKSLKQECQDAKKVYDTSGETAYEPLAISIYARLRKTWERAIEEVLLEGVVVRFRSGIATRQMKHLEDITKADLEAVDRGMTKSSKWEGGHDHAEAAHEPVPVPSELLADVETLEAWVNGINARRQ